MLALRPLTSAVLLVATLTACGESRGEYRFWLDGEPIEPEILALVGEPGAPRPGDVVIVGGHRGYKMVLDGPGEYRYLTTRNGNLRREYPDGRVPLVHLVLGDAWDAEFEETPNPSELRGVRVADGWGEHAETLRMAPEERCFIEVYTFADAITSATLSERTTYLDVRLATGELSSILAGFSSLRYLDMAVLFDDTDEERGRVLQSIDWVEDLRDLRHLSVAGTGVRDLRPLDGHSRLRFLCADDAPVEFLPTVALPELRRFDAVDWACSEEEVERFRQLQPSTRFVVGPTERIRDRLRDAKRLRVVRRNTYGPDGAPVPPIFTTSDPRVVADLVSLLRFEDRYRSWQGYIPGATNLQLQFLDDRGDVTYTIGFFPSKEVIVRGTGLVGVREKPIPPDVRDALAAWFADRGVQLFR